MFATQRSSPSATSRVKLEYASKNIFLAPFNWPESALNNPIETTLKNYIVRRRGARDIHPSPAEAHSTIVNPHQVLPAGVVGNGKTFVCDGTLRCPCTARRSHELLTSTHEPIRVPVCVFRYRYQRKSTETDTLCGVIFTFVSGGKIISSHVTSLELASAT